MTELSIPGTHNSGCTDGPFGFAQTQDLDLPDQLTAGIRFLDLRLAHYQDNLFVHHDVVHMGKSYADVLAICSDFLRLHPSEAVFMSVKEEDRVDSALGRFAPSQILGKSRGDAEDRGTRSSSFEEEFTARTWQHVDDASLFYNFTATVPDTRAAASRQGLTSETTLGDVRGKIVLLRRFEGAGNVGHDVTYWPENETFRSATAPAHDVHDRYQGLGGEEKYELVVAHLEVAKKGDPRDLYITFASAVSLKARGYAEEINPRLNDYLAGSPKGRVGIIALDYFEQPRELVSHVIAMNAYPQPAPR
ncbi:MAG: phosphatidylinositol-specific phospholipase C [Pseudonocardiaceae bacterium]